MGHVATAERASKSHLQFLWYRLCLVAYNPHELPLERKAPQVKPKVHSVVSTLKIRDDLKSVSAHFQDRNLEKTAPAPPANVGWFYKLPLMAEYCVSNLFIYL